MKHIDVTDLPDDIAAAIQKMVDSLRARFCADRLKKETLEKPLTTTPGNIIGPITRESLYDEYLDRKLG
jgi:hypothetical protein